KRRGRSREALKIDGMQGGNKVDAAVHDFQSSHNTKNLQVKLRHGPSLYNCKINYTEGNKAKLKLDGNDQGIARGQFAVFYHGDICLGSAIIN
ncbi:hypothetical protein HY604_02760, partial [Candidatus Peregrinibacteria bacterium]|nr:hypothetical protein [Candidatus Peregrinibacteria bacterium]